MNRLCRRWLSEVHSTNSNSPTSSGFSHRHSDIFAAVRPAPQRPAFFSGRFANGQTPISSGLIFLNSSIRNAGVNPFRVRAAGRAPKPGLASCGGKFDGRWELSTGIWRDNARFLALSRYLFVIRSMEDSDMPPFRQPPPTRLARELFANPKMCLVMHDDHEELDRRRRPTIYEA